MGDPQSVPSDGTPINVRTLEANRLNAFATSFDGLESLEIKRSVRATLGKKQVPTINANPVPLLPGSLSTLEVTYQHDGRFEITRKLNLDPDLGDRCIYFSANQGDLSRPKISISLNEDETTKLLQTLECVNLFINELNVRARTVEERNLHIVIPSCLYVCISTIESLFAGGAMAELDKPLGLLHEFLDKRKTQFYELIDELKQINARVSGSTQTPDPTSDDNFHLPTYNIDNFADGRISTVYQKYLGDHRPVQEAKKYVRDAIKNLIFDFYFVNPEEWHLDESRDVAAKSWPLKLRLSEGDADIQRRYTEIEKLHEITINALEAQTSQTENTNLAQSKDICDEIRDVLRESRTTRHILEHGPEVLQKKLVDISREHKLDEVMLHGIRNEYPGIAESLKGGPR